MGGDLVRKGAKYLLEAFNFLKLDNSELWIVGKNQRDIAEKIVKIEKNNIFIDSVTEFKLPDLYNQSSIFCLPTFEEGLPTVLPQAMACALPIISTQYAKDCVTDGQEGFIIEPGSTSLISEKIKFFYDNPNKIIEATIQSGNLIIEVDNRMALESNLIIAIPSIQTDTGNDFMTSLSILGNTAQILYSI